MAQGSEDFYTRLPPFEEFDGFTEFEAYAPVPDDWMVVAADIQGSTAAIAEGRYKEVNMVGAAVITAVLNAAHGHDYPYVFGGDGAAVLVPASAGPAALAAMRRLMRFAAREYRLTLRAALVPVARLRAEGHDLRVRKLRLSPGNHLAMISGGGLARADAILKGDPPDPAVLAAAEGEEAPDLDGLSCRWEPLEPRRGRMVALIVVPLSPQGAAGVLRDTLAAIGRILRGPVSAHAPVSDASLRFRFPPRGLMLEARAAARGGLVILVWARAFMTAAVQAVAERFRLRVGPYDQPRYREELKANTDFRKFDDALRTVLDVTPAQAGAIQEYLEDQFRAGRLAYGLHSAEQALMTCLVFSMTQSEHVHFVDAAGGGFARAAEGLKRRLTEARGLSPPAPPGG